ncbi:DUF3090 domain-containing protein [Granulicoccus sp. GXG6511]|uniref:DUF3090 domain-containing protein n=1 Tax=Granulicoccus sp. GXG6511 TaxID=3381351 RepID=UPI003D7C3885
MAIVEHRYDAPDRFVSGTVGEPGDRTFFLQARQGNRLTSVTCEKQQVSVLAEHVDRVLAEIARLSGGLVSVPPERDTAYDNEPLDAPITEEFRVGTMTIAWDPSDSRIVIEMFSVSEEELDIEVDDTAGADEAAEALARAEAERAGEVLIVRIAPTAARDFVARSMALVAAGRPACPFCQQPIDPDGHICPRANGYRRPLF